MNASSAMLCIEIKWQPSIKRRSTNWANVKVAMERVYEFLSATHLTNQSIYKSNTKRSADASFKARSFILVACCDFSFDSWIIIIFKNLYKAKPAPSERFTQRWMKTAFFCLFVCCWTQNKNWKKLAFNVRILSIRSIQMIRFVCMTIATWLRNAWPISVICQTLFFRLNEKSFFLSFRYKCQWRWSLDELYGIRSFCTVDPALILRKSHDSKKLTNRTKKTC